MLSTFLPATLAAAKILTEIKGVILEENGVVIFPDASAASEE